MLLELNFTYASILSAEIASSGVLPVNVKILTKTSDNRIGRRPRSSTDYESPLIIDPWT